MTVLPPTATVSQPASTAADATAPVPAVCPPLADLTQAGLEEAIVNPYSPPPFGSDDPHQGIDLARFLPGTRIAVGGAPVQAVLAGTVALVIADRFPYGNAVLVETPIEVLKAAGWQPPEQDSEIQVLSTLTCPGETVIGSAPARASIYLLYAHLEALPPVTMGEEVACGGSLGRIGDTGNALNPHLHLEVRIGPSSAVFPGMSHYDASASIAEMDGYCAWRVGGLFRPVDPMLLLQEVEK